MEEANREVSDTNVIVGSMDMEALYPSIRVGKSASIVGEMVRERAW